MTWDPPIFINCRDRVAHLRELVAWLEKAGHERIVLLDNDSTYEPLIDYLKASPHDIYALGENAGSRALWRANLVPDEWFVYTDPDVLPTGACPLDAVAHLRELLDSHPEHAKAALGLYLDDVPETVQSLSWERRLLDPRLGDAWLGEIDPGVFDTLSDTTFALYRPGAAFSLRAMRTSAPYQVRHMPWYHLDAPDDDERYYLERAIKGPLGSSWAEGKQ